MKTLFFFVILLLPVSLTAQDFNYVHYDTEDGLAGSTVYSMCQDKYGFMWFATENGLSRYDGTHFKNFTVKDGLPDNEVLKVFADSKGRVWIGTFSKELCYYYENKIYTRHNNSLLKKIDLEASLYSIAEDENHFLGMSGRASVVIITPQDSIVKYDLNSIYKGNYTYGNSVGVNRSGKLNISNDKFEAFGFDKVDFKWKPFSIVRNTVEVDTNSFTIIIKLKDSSRDGKDTMVTLPGKFIAGDGQHFTKYVNTTDGVWKFNSKITEGLSHYLAGKKISGTIEDKENNIWFSSFGEGVYKLSSESVKNFLFAKEGVNNSNEVFSIIEFENKILIGTEASHAYYIDKNFKVTALNYAVNETFAGPYMATNRLYSMANISGAVLILGFDKFLVKLENRKSFFNYLFPIKSVAKINDEFIIVGTSAFAFKMRLKDMLITDTLWRERCTKVFYQNNKYYIGTLNGLYEVKEDKTYTWLGNLHRALTRRITDIKNTVDGTLWVATSDNGIVAFKNGKIVKSITDSNGLSSNICKTLFIDNKLLWVGTDKGINKINTANSQYNIIKYSASDGLPSNVINALYVKDSIVWVGSPSGLTYFNENSIYSSSICNLKMLQIKVSGKEIKMDSVFQLLHTDNNINFEYAGISLRSGGEITYYYKLTGLDDEWKTTTENNLDYKSLPGGEYKLHLYAINKYGVKSNLLTFQFSIAIPFWKSGGFYLLLSLLAIVVVVAVFNHRNKITKQRLEERNSFQKQFAALEQQALQSQMNPHFIFNCLNSIQQYILTNDKEKANEYLTGFASLIRQTLDISAQKKISVAEEASYLTRYIEMERMRFGDSFSYTIALDPAIKADHIQMPALLLQPYVENAIRHGMRYKTGGIGKIEISFSIKDENLCCMVKDNGIGRQQADEFKSKGHIEYQSKGMNLTAKRIQLLNTMDENNISVAIQDLKNDDNTPAGTLVEINLTI